MGGRTYWTDERIELLLRCNTDQDLRESFPDKSMLNLQNQRSRFRRARPDLAPVDIGRLNERPRGDDLGPPPGWRPSIEESSSEVKATTRARPAREESADEHELLEMVGLNPDDWRVTAVRRSRWQQREDGDFLEAYKVSAERKAEGVDLEELAELRRQVSILEAPQRDTGASTEPESTLVVVASDWQFGKGERGGSEATLERLEASLAAVMTRAHNLRAGGENIGRVALVGLGDLFEGCSGHYAMQEFQTDLTRREQMNIVRRVLLRWIRRLSTLGLPVTVAAIGGNHGENRRKGKAYTTFGDNDDVAVFEQIADIVSEAPEAFGEPRFVIPGDDLTATLELSGARVGLVHGHQFGSGPSGSMTWWQKQTLGNQPIGAAQILLSGHFHHLEISTWSDRTHIQVPAMDGGSQWFRERNGVDAPPGVVTLLVGEGLGPLAWRGLWVV